MRNWIKAHQGYTAGIVLVVVAFVLIMVEFGV